MIAAAAHKTEVHSSKTFNHGDADVVFQSCDGVRFHIHRKNLETATGGFPPPEFETCGETVHLTESARTLELLFQFIYPRRHPSLECEVIEVIAPLAEAAEKYEVFPAMNICHVRMTNYVLQHPKEVMIYAGRHGYHELLDRAAPLVIAEPLKSTLNSLPSSLVVPWVHFYEAWNTALRRVCTFEDPTHPWPNDPCSCLITKSRLIYRRLGEGVQALREIFTIFFHLTGCDSCRPIIQSWSEFAQKEVASVPKFSTFL